MSRHLTFQEGQLLRYKGKEFEQFDNNQPFMDFLGYDSNGWTDLWVNYQGNEMRIDGNDVEAAESKS